MSIINEALKKALKEKTSAHTPSVIHENLRKNFEIEFEKKKSTVNWGPIFVISVLLLITGPIIAPFFSTPFRRTDLPTQVAATAAEPGTSNVVQGQTQLAGLPAGENAANRKSQFAIEEFPLFRQAPSPIVQTPYLNLSGIMVSPNASSYCIINDEVYSQGQIVRGAKIVSILPDEVLLEHKGQTIRLFVTR